MREKIARLPPEVSEVSHLANLKSSDEGRELMAKVSVDFLTVYRFAFAFERFASSFCFFQ